MKNVEASIRARLMRKAKERAITFQYASILYMQEGLLARIAGSAYSGKLILTLRLPKARARTVSSGRPAAPGWRTPSPC